jgi:hypothetical protein
MKWRQYFDSLRKNIIPEDLNAAQQNARMTDVATGSAPNAPTTPERGTNITGRKWDEEEDETQIPQDQVAKSLSVYTRILSAGNEALSKSFKKTERQKQKEFAIEKLEKSLDEVNSKYFYLSNREKLLYKSYLRDQAIEKISSIKNWINKRG